MGSLAVRALLLALLLAPAPSRAEAGRADEDEVRVVPAIAYDSDLGLGLGAMGAVARLREGARPYLWRLEALAYTTFKLAPETGRLQAIQHDHHLVLDAPALAGGRSRLRLEAGYGRRINLGYYGFGPAAAYDPDRLLATPRLHQYRQASPGGAATYQRVIREGRWGQLRSFLRGELRYSQLSLYPGSLLEADLGRPADDPVRRLLQGREDHLDLVAGAGALLDGRDDELAPTGGHLLALGARGGSAIGAALLWGGLTADLRVYRTLVPGRLSAALRLAGDLLLGRPPFYELSEIGGPRPFSATGGAIGLRGVLARRFHGLGKVLTNLELRAFLTRFRVFGARFELRALAFSDLGLVFADPLGRSIEGPPRLGVGLGGGLRLLWGRTFLVRADYGVSPTDGTTGFYLDLGHVF